MATKDTIILQPATRDDIARLAEIHVIACLPDNAFKLYFDTPAEFNRRVTEMLEDQVGEAAWRHIKAVDSTTGTIAAWASSYTLSDEQLRVEAAEADARSSTHDPGAHGQYEEIGIGKEEEQEKEKEKGKFDFPPGLPAYVLGDTNHWLTRSTRRWRHMQCKALFTDPLFQGRGMGSALVSHGNTVADAAGLPIFLQASPYGFPVYFRLGFDTVQHLDVDLREWALDAHRGDQGFGNYRFRYMVRLPETLPEESKSSRTEIIFSG